MRGLPKYLVFVLLTWCAACGPSAVDDAEASDSTTLALISSGNLVGVARGCAGRLDDIDAFGIAEEQPELLVALHPTLGSPVCVDTFEALEAALANRPVMADRLWQGYLTSLHDLASTIEPELLTDPRSTSIDE